MIDISKIQSSAAIFRIRSLALLCPVKENKNLLGEMGECATEKKEGNIGVEKRKMHTKMDRKKSLKHRNTGISSRKLMKKVVFFKSLKWS